MPYPSLEVMKKLANELLNAPEACVPWEPIPARFAYDWQVDVTHMAEDYGEDRPTGENLTIAVAAFVEATETAPREEGAWRIDFTDCKAYRQRIIHYTGSVPLTSPDPTGRIGTAFWEITGSHYFVESRVWDAHYSQYFHQRFHHYVILSALHTVHEVIARLALHAASPGVGTAVRLSDAKVATSRGMIQPLPRPSVMPSRCSRLE